MNCENPQGRKSTIYCHYFCKAYEYYKSFGKGIFKAA